MILMALGHVLYYTAPSASNELFDDENYDQFGRKYGQADASTLKVSLYPFYVHETQLLKFVLH